MNLGPVALAWTPGRYLGIGQVCADYDNDGWVDLYLLTRGANVLFHNRVDRAPMRNAGRSWTAAPDPRQAGKPESHGRDSGTLRGARALSARAVQGILTHCKEI